jgi:hypothetical protein
MNLHLGTLQIQNLFSEQNDKPVTGFQSFAKLFTESQTTLSSLQASDLDTFKPVVKKMKPFYACAISLYFVTNLTTL